MENDQLSQVKWDADTDPSGVHEPTGVVWDNDKYGTAGQQGAAALEGLASGVVSRPVVAGAERLFGLDPEGFRKRAEANPWTSGVSEAVGLGGSALSGVGAGAALGKIGEAASAASKLAEGASTVSKIAAAGVRTGAEMATLQASDEVAKQITQDPGASLGQAAINIGLSGLIGGAGGAALGAVSPLWKSSMEKMGVPKLIDDAKAQYGFRQSVEGGDVPAAISKELETRLSEVDSMRNQMSELKGQSLARAMPEMSDVSTSKINEQIEQISSDMTKSIEKASDNAYLKSSVPKLSQDFQEFLEVATDPKASYTDKFEAIDALKKAQQAKSKYNLTSEDTALGEFTKDIARDLRLKLEDTKVWGDAGDIQRKVNAAIKESIDAEKDAASKFTQKSAVEGGRVVDQGKVNTLVNQSLKGTAGVKGDFVGNYTKLTDKLADTINKIHVDAGIEAPIRLTPTPALDHTLGRSSAGTTLGNWLYDKGLASVVGHVGAEGVGASLGSLVGHPAFGALAGEKFLAPAFISIAKPLMENASKAEAFKSSLDYVASVIKGEKLLNNATEAVFKAGGEILPSYLMPSTDSRKKLEKSLDYASNIDNAVNIGGHVGHYLPSHASTAAAMSAKATSYLNGLKPTQPKGSPLDKPMPVDKWQQQKYNRALDIAQQPLMILKHAKNGTLQAQDVSTLNTIYPQLHGKIVNSVYDQMVKHTSSGNSIPYHQRQSLSLLMGTPLDSTLTQPSMQAIMMSNQSGRAAQQASNGQPPRQKAVSAVTAKAMEKSNSLYATMNQSRAANRTGH